MVVCEGSYCRGSKIDRQTSRREVNNDVQNGRATQKKLRKDKKGKYEGGIIRKRENGNEKWEKRKREKVD